MQKPDIFSKIFSVLVEKWEKKELSILLHLEHEMSISGGEITFQNVKEMIRIN